MKILKMNLKNKINENSVIHYKKMINSNFFIKNSGNKDKVIDFFIENQEIKDGRTILIEKMTLSIIKMIIMKIKKKKKMIYLMKYLLQKTFYHI